MRMKRFERLHYAAKKYAWPNYSLFQRSIRSSTTLNGMQRSEVKLLNGTLPNVKKYLPQLSVSRISCCNAQHR